MRNISKHLLSASIICSAVISISATAADSKTGTINIDKVLNELTRQHNDASSLVKTARQPTSLTFNSPLITQSGSSAKQDEPVLEKLTAVASNTVKRFKQTGLASWYGRQFHGRKTANGETFNMNAMTAAHRSLPLNCYIRVTNKDNGKSVIVKINDRGPFNGNRMLDLSYGAAQAIGIAQHGTGNVIIERVDEP